MRRFAVVIALLVAGCSNHPLAPDVAHNGTLATARPEPGSGVQPMAMDSARAWTAHDTLYVRGWVRSLGETSYPDPLAWDLFVRLTRKQDWGYFILGGRFISQSRTWTVDLMSENGKVGTARVQWNWGRHEFNVAIPFSIVHQVGYPSDFNGGAWVQVNAYKLIDGVQYSGGTVNVETWAAPDKGRGGVSPS